MRQIHVSIRVSSDQSDVRRQAYHAQRVGKRWSVGDGGRAGWQSGHESDSGNVVIQPPMADTLKRMWLHGLNLF